MHGQLFDAANRYWIATQRDLLEWSYLDVYENVEYVGSVKVRDRLRGFDLVGSTLVVLVDRQVRADDADGVPDRALDWYDIGELPFGHRYPRAQSAIICMRSWRMPLLLTRGTRCRNTATDRRVTQHRLRLPRP